MCDSIVAVAACGFYHPFCNVTSIFLLNVVIRGKRHTALPIGILRDWKLMNPLLHTSSKLWSSDHAH